jgi:hypothetical protein
MEYFSSVLHLSNLKKLENGLHMYCKTDVIRATLLLHRLYQYVCQNRQNFMQIIITKYPLNVKNKEKDQIEILD